MMIKMKTLAISMSLLTLLFAGVPQLSHAANPSNVDFNTPPSSFDPLTASPDSLKKYGFPEKPSDPNELATWNEHMKHAKNFIAPQLQIVTDHGHYQKPKLDKTTPSATVNSGNWSGYKVEPNLGSAFTKISGDFFVPNVSSSTVDSYECSWVGLGGWNSTHLIQAGTESDLTTHWYGNTTNYYVWTEQLPDQPTEQKVSNFPVSPGDQMYVHIEYATHVDGSGNTVGNTTFYIENLTQSNYTYWVTSSVNAINDYDGSTAEWVDERPTVGGSLPNLAKFGSVNWTNLYAATPSVSSKLGDWGRDQIVMENGSTVLASPNADYNYNNNSFTNYWYSYN